MVRLVLGDDQDIFVGSLAAALPRWGYTVVAMGGTLGETSAHVRKHQPDVCVLDRYFSDGDTVDALVALLGAGLRTRFVILASDGQTEVVRDAMRAGAVGYVHKARGLDVLTGTVQRVLAGETVVELAGSRGPFSSGNADARRLASQLTARERECLRLLMDGAHTSAMARVLGVSSTTVRTHVQSILTKLGVHSRLEAASFALRHALVERVERSMPRDPHQTAKCR